MLLTIPGFFFSLGGKKYQEFSLVLLIFDECPCPLSCLLWSYYQIQIISSLFLLLPFSSLWRRYQLWWCRPTAFTMTSWSMIWYWLVRLGGCASKVKCHKKSKVLRRTELKWIKLYSFPFCSLFQVNIFDDKITEPGQRNPLSSSLMPRLNSVW